MTIVPDDILDFWFEGDASIRRPKWFEKNDAFDRACARFIPDIRAARGGVHDSWALTPKSSLGLILLLDQLPRNVFRGQAESFASDSRAQAVAGTTIACGFDKSMTPFERMFVYLPYEHAETIPNQDEAVRLFELLRGLLGENTVEYAYRHRDVIRTFGRFPHRNATLGRVNTPAEEVYLSQPGASF